MGSRTNSSRSKPKWTVLDVVNAFLPPGFGLVLAAPAQATKVTVARDVETALADPEMRRAWERIRKLQARAASSASHEKRRELLKKSDDLTRRFFVEREYDLPPDPRPRLELMGPTDYVLDQHGTLYRPRPGRSRFSWGLWQSRKPGPRSRFTPQDIAKMREQRAKGLSDRRIAQLHRCDRKTVRHHLGPRST